MEGTRERLAGAQAAEGQMRRDIGSLRSAVEQGLRECRYCRKLQRFLSKEAPAFALQTHICTTQLACK